jgi:hypothetical protein
VGELNIRFYLSKHATERMSQRGVDKQTIQRALQLGNYIEQSKKVFRVITEFLIVVISFSSNKRNSCIIHTVFQAYT